MSQNVWDKKTDQVREKGRHTPFKGLIPIVDDDNMDDSEDDNNVYSECTLLRHKVDNLVLEDSDELFNPRSSSKYSFSQQRRPDDILEMEKQEKSETELKKKKRVSNLDPNRPRWQMFGTTENVNLYIFQKLIL